MQQIDQARQSLANIGYQINSIGGGQVDPQALRQTLQGLVNAVTALVSAVDEIDRCQTPLPRTLALQAGQV